MKIEIPSNIKGIIFDMDGTLVDSLPVHFAAWDVVMEKHNTTYPRELFDEFSGLPVTKIVPIVNKRLGLNLNTEEVVREKEIFLLNNIDMIKPIKPVMDVVLEYHKKLPMSIGTGSVKHITLAVLKKLNLEKYFNAVVTADDVNNHKPEPDTFLKCAELMNVDPKECVVLEDGEKGIEAAIKGGIPVIDVRKYI